MADHDIEIVVDGLAVPVDAGAYKANPDAVIDAVRGAREAMQLGDDVPEADDYDTAVGDDS